MDIYNYLKKDHEKVSKLMQQVTEQADPQERQRLFETICEELLLHARTEQKTFYTALEKHGGKHLQEQEEHAEEEHEEIETLIKELRALKPSDDKWLIKFGALQHAVEHHVEEEEGDIFEKAKKVISDTQAQKLAQEMDQLKQNKGGNARL